MKSVLVIDHNEISILMTVEACKDVIKKAQVQVAYTGKEALEKIEKNEFELIIVDFDLPDCDGVSFIKELKKNKSIPMFLTAFPDSVVIDALQKELYWYKDASRLIPKPVNFKKLKEIISDFVFKEKKLVRAFKPTYSAEIIPRKNKTKKTEMSTQIINMTIESISLKYSQSVLFSKNEEIIMKLSPGKNTKKIPVPKGFFISTTVFWVDLKKRELKLVFKNLSSSIQKRVENLLKKAKVLDP